MKLQRLQLNVVVLKMMRGDGLTRRIVKVNAYLHVKNIMPQCMMSVPNLEVRSI
ncbi:hypothetical protein SAMN02745220_01031 [Desulfopila aestuarii DSM 18488]|uniref:Uncharacterized protein n=1 Tax=Desulfopila aestuarii DSM 18488 TaxID=1121416 RepID=A0A1M7Y0S6_9BACT|nr:hypothetical protein SAMN02745220_01031 [Desulfopila aestuarii DSM 18488]